jgi:hypothetical protein
MYSMLIFTCTCVSIHILTDHLQVGLFQSVPAEAKGEAQENEKCGISRAAEQRRREANQTPKLQDDLRGLRIPPQPRGHKCETPHCTLLYIYIYIHNTHMVCTLLS